MPGWRDEYLASIREQEKNNPVNLELVDLCSQLADRLAAVEAEKELLASKASSLAGKPSDATAAKQASAATSGESPDPALVAQLRYDLAEALRARGNHRTRSRKAEEELAQLRARTSADAQLIKELAADKAALATRLKDREHELREKRKLVEDVQDEMITLNLQVSMAEKERDKVKKENKELVDRWMKRMGQEADAMNLANER